MIGFLTGLLSMQMITSKGSETMSNEEPKFNVDLSTLGFALGRILNRKNEPKIGGGKYREIKDTDGANYQIWESQECWYLVNMTTGDTLKHFDSEEELINHYFGNYDPSKPEG